MKRLTAARKAEKGVRLKDWEVRELCAALDLPSSVASRLAVARNANRGASLTPAEVIRLCLIWPESAEVRHPPLAPVAQTHIRWMIRRDMNQVHAIEQGSFPDPWSEDDFVRCLRQRNCIGMVAVDGDRVQGFVVYELHRERLEILHLAVDPAARRRRIGAAIVGCLQEKVVGRDERRRRVVRVAIKEGNLEAQLFFRAAGFRATLVAHGFYENSDEAAYLFEYRAPEWQKGEF